MKGTEKQIKWACDISAKITLAADGIIAYCKNYDAESFAEVIQFVSDAIDKIKTCTYAGHIIDVYSESAKRIGADAHRNYDVLCMAWMNALDSEHDYLSGSRAKYSRQYNLPLQEQGAVIVPEAYAVAYKKFKNW